MKNVISKKTNEEVKVRCGAFYVTKGMQFDEWNVEGDVKSEILNFVNEAIRDSGLEKEVIHAFAEIFPTFVNQNHPAPPRLSIDIPTKAGARELSRKFLLELDAELKKKFPYAGINIPCNAG